MKIDEPLSKLLGLTASFLIYFYPTQATSEIVDNFSIKIMGRSVGYFSIYQNHETQVKKITVTGEVSGTPLRIFDGVFNSSLVTTAYDDGTKFSTYVSKQIRPSKSREIHFQKNERKLVSVQVNPLTQRTALSEPFTVMTEFTDPITALLRLTRFPCAEDFTIYDGRRLTRVRKELAKSDNECEYTYQVNKGPGHLAPFYIRNLQIITKKQDLMGNRSLQITARLGPFTLQFTSDRD